MSKRKIDVIHLLNTFIVQTSTARRPSVHSARPSRTPALLKPSAELSCEITPLARPRKAIKLPYGGYRGAELWPDGELRINDPVHYLDADRELVSILKTLATLNRTGLYSAFYDYAPHVGILTVQIYEGRWNYRKKPVLKTVLNCRRFPLRDEETNREVTAEEFSGRLIRMVQ